MSTAQKHLDTELTTLRHPKVVQNPVKNDLLERAGGTRYRLLHVTEDGQAWVVNVSDPNCWPMQCQYASLISSIAADELSIVVGSESQLPFYSHHADVRRRKAWEVIEPLVADTAIFDSTLRGPLVKARAEETGISKTTIYKYLNTYWCGGQSQQALLPNFLDIGTKQTGNTHGRGRVPKGERYEIFQMDPKVDVPNIKEAVEKHYLNGEVSTLKHAWLEMLREKYSYLDGNGNQLLKPSGERPSIRQFRTVFKKNFSYETTMRRKKGNKDFDRDHGQNITGALYEAICVGHIYEIDATIADVWLVAKDNRAKIIGKPTMYLIYDRYSRLCVGFYVGLEHASWEAAMQAILSIAEDKEALCAKYNVPYDPADWLADGYFGQKFLGDLGEMISRNSNRICDGMQSTVANTRALSPQSKGTVECGFKLIHASIASLTPGYEPPRNATRRRGKHYDRDASLTLDEFIALILAAIIKHNRNPMRGYDMPPTMALRECPPIPREIWADNLRQGAGAMSRYSAEYLHLQLLPRDKAIVRGKGIYFKGCYYTCPELEKLGWFVMAENKGTWDVEVSYDRRLVDEIIVYDPKNSRRHYTCTLTDRNLYYAGYSFAEVKYVQSEVQATILQGEDDALQHRADFHKFAEAITKPARDAARKATNGASRASRKADIAADRIAERATRRQKEAAITKPSSRGKGSPSPATAPNNVVPIHGHGARDTTHQTATSNTSSTEPKMPTGAPSAAPADTPEPSLTLQEKLRLKRQELINGIIK
ncbi:Mu transposase C-terminal domain-containing protein [Paraburkholderia sp. C35]|uniref:Mu transposase C-terminal domain-containing protein n=1 Tax=Paraburkholderia sp. C35 TaxID=2126993 RepID=UPI000D692CE8|nr:Mu transposase C-terminal domain-containing protein [Paraburkholderia sp. C35]